MMKPVRPIPEGGEPSPGEALRMSVEDDPLTCVHCGQPIVPGELYLPAGRCAMGGVVTGSGAVLYNDVLEPAGEHLRCIRRAPE